MHDTNLLEDQPIAWTPTPEVVKRARLTEFMRQVGVSTWDELYEFSIRDVEKFTEEVLKFLDIRFDPPYEKLLDTTDGVELPTWFGRSGDTPVPIGGSSAESSSERRSGVDGRSVPAPLERKGWYRSLKLPHFDGQVTQFITFRLADSLPQSVLERLKLQLEHDKLQDDSEAYRQRVEDYLDGGHGECILRDPALAQIVAETLLYEDGKSCDLKAWVVMPNHAHILVRMFDGHDLGGLMKRVKGVSARKINQHLGREGSVWQADYFDRYIRDGKHFSTVLHYIEQNPVVSRLVTSADQWPFGSAHRSEDTPVPIGGCSAENSSADGSSRHRSGVDGDKSVPAPSAGLNITEMCLDRWEGTEVNDQSALVWEGEDGEVKSMAYRRLALEVMKCASGLKAKGINQGDAVGIHLPMLPETVISLLAINRIGAIAVPVFSGYGVDAISSRLNAVGAKALITCDGFKRRGKLFDALEVATQAVATSPTVKFVFVFQSDGKTFNYEGGTAKYFDFGDIYRLTRIERPSGWGLPAPTSAEDPLIILYTSGTTGKPKGIAHTHASFPIKAAQDMAFGTDVGRGTRICWYTDIGWMMGPWLIYGALINGATICIYDGAPDYPTADRMWEFCARHKVEVLGISPTLIRALAASEQTSGSPPYARSEVASASSADDGVVLSSKADARETDRSTKNHPTAKAAPLLRKEGSKNLAPFERHDLSSLRIFASTGEPWNPAPWWWLFEKVGDSKLPIINYSGGTEIAGGILMGNPLLAIKPCSFPAPCPGMDVDILDEDGNSVTSGKVGELVIKQPWIGMARGFWQEKERYLETYWRRFKDIWVHGDWAMRDKDGHWFILGRSDDTLKVAGKRVGPAEVESLLVAHPLVTEAAVIGVPDEAKGTAMVAFAVANDEYRISNIKSTDSEHSSFDIRYSELATELKALVARDMGKPLAPSKIHFVSALPKTRNAKVMRRVIRAAYLGEDPGDLSALENPGAFEEIANAGK